MPQHLMTQGHLTLGVYMWIDVSTCSHSSEAVIATFRHIRSRCIYGRKKLSRCDSLGPASSPDLLHAERTLLALKHTSHPRERKVSLAIGTCIAGSLALARILGAASTWSLQTKPGHVTQFAEVQPERRLSGHQLSG